jgi:hypothetical protein
VTAAEVKDWCAALARGDAEGAYRAAWALTEAPAQAVPHLNEMAVALKTPPRGEVLRWIEELDHKRFAVRERAMRQLTALDDAAEVLEAALKGNMSLEKRRRLQQVLKAIRTRPAAPVRLFAVRAVLVLERIGNDPARALLREFASGEPEARLTQEARAALRRLAP